MTGKNGKLTVLDEAEDTRVPFLRGILTRSLVDAGLPFDEAFGIATTLRDSLSAQSEVTTVELREAVSRELEDRGLDDVLVNYRTPRNERVSAYVEDRNGACVPFSKTILVQSLEVCAESRETLYAVAAAVERELVTLGGGVIRSRELMRITYEKLVDLVGRKSSRRYLTWQEFNDTDHPLIVLIGGVTGTGKSTVASVVANRLGIVRTQSTDMLREVMRRMIPKRLIPSLHESSFLAHRTLPRWGQDDGELAEPHMVDGFLMQAEEVAVGVDGVFRRAIREQVSVIIEGVHMHPQLQRSLVEREDAVVVPVFLAELKKKTLKRHLVGRGKSVTSRRAKRYLDSFDEIWNLQSYLLSEADRNDIPIIGGNDSEQMARRIMRVIADRLEEEYEGDPTALLSKSTDPTEDAGQAELEEGSESGPDRPH